MYLTRRERESSDERILYSLLQSGTVDLSDMDRPREVAQRSLRYSAALADRLWSLVEEERSKVCEPSRDGCEF